ncbi:hypothetical protein COU80_00615 [Candidatus Peregrinibacteria bacterium CG10_big_fil_rev_8_21_14_0_10_55_24]|nr:MAG: hypothetical protein COU80_00615 [Candidatus Peregrinibacteria bacterium CG10_big_fil_rev_8_21_14_0_10_55_24]
MVITHILHRFWRSRALCSPVLAFAFVPAVAAAQEGSALGEFPLVSGSLTLLAWIAGGAAVGVLLTIVWRGIANHLFIHHETIASIEARRPYLPGVIAIVGTLIATAGLFVLSLKVMRHVEPFHQFSLFQIGFFFTAMACAGSIVELRWRWARGEVFAVLVGTFIAFILLAFNWAIFNTGLREDPFLMALGIVGILLLWRLLFGPWSVHIKATVLATFVGWVAIHLLLKETPQERLAHLLAAGIAILPALVWCWLFLEYHRQRKGLVLLMFLAGMLSTAPILFYDALVRSQAQFQFFLFRIVPENFNSVTNALVSGSLLDMSGTQSTVLATLISFLIVGFIEEFSKFWVLKQSGKPFFSSIDDVIQLAVIVAIGFAFAENVLNPSYFIGFIREYLIEPEEAQWGLFLGNVTGRAILTTMVHIVSSGVMGYFLGLAIFARSCLEDERREGSLSLLPTVLHWVLLLPRKHVYRVQMLLTGILLSTMLHGLFNFMVTLPEILPGNPQNMGQLFGVPDSPLRYISLLLLPSLLYVVGGFWLFSFLFYRSANMKERGRLVTTDAFVTAHAVA